VSRIDDLSFKILRSFTLLMEAKSPDLWLHSLRVASLAVALGRALDLSERAQLELEVAARLHDLGKLALPDVILGKGESLGEAETAAIRAHPVLGERILSPLPLTDEVRKAVRSHHERMSGEGYPDGLRGEEIPLGARIVAICDAYDAMTNPRSYRPPKATEKALVILIQDDGQQWDPRLTETFVRVVRQEPSRTGPGLLSLDPVGFGTGRAGRGQSWPELDGLMGGRGSR